MITLSRRFSAVAAASFAETLNVQAVSTTHFSNRNYNIFSSQRYNALVRTCIFVLVIWIIQASQLTIIFSIVQDPDLQPGFKCRRITELLALLKVTALLSSFFVFVKLIKIIQLSSTMFMFAT